MSGQTGDARIKKVRTCRDQSIGNLPNFDKITIAQNSFGHRYRKRNGKQIKREKEEKKRRSIDEERFFFFFFSFTVETSATYTRRNSLW